jgi:hypothetical protein
MNKMAAPCRCDRFIQNQNDGITISTMRVRNPTGEVSLCFPVVVPASLVRLQRAAPDTVPSMWPQGRDEIAHL